MSNQKPFTTDDAAEYVRGWDSFDAIATTAVIGVAREDRDRLADAGYDLEQAASVLRDYCRSRVAAAS